MFVFLARVPGAAGTSAGRGDLHKEPWAQWSVCLRDHVHHTWLCCGLLEQVTAYEQGRVVPDACGAVLVPRERPLAELVGRLDPKMHRSERRLVVRALYLEPHVAVDGDLLDGLAGARCNLACFLGATAVTIDRSEPLPVAPALSERLAMSSRPARQRDAGSR